MEPKSLSASAAHVFELCPARYGAESFARTPNSNNSAADLGTAVHDALEKWCLTNKMQDPEAELKELVLYFDAAYDNLFGADASRKEEGRDLCEKWYVRSHPIEHEILSAEIKESFPIKVKHPETGEQFVLPFNYIWDRCDRLPDGEIDVVDYKTISMYLNAEQMREKLQVRCYGLAAQVKYPNAPRIWVTYDMLRHGDPLGVSFTKEENIETYRYLQGLLVRILAADANHLEEKVNDECRWCIRKQVCSALRKHANVGGVHAITDPAVAAERRMKMSQVQGALKVAIEELDGMLMKHMKQEDLLEEEFGSTKVIVSAQGKRDVDTEQVKRAVPDEVWETYAASKLTMGNLDKMMKDERLTDEQRQAVKRLITKKFGAPRIVTKAVADDEDEA